jgi:hypothetical protein
MVVVVMRVQHVLDRPVGDAADLLGDEIEAVGELVVDDDDAVVGHTHRHVAARLPTVESGDDVEAVHQFTNLKPRFLLGGEGGDLLAGSPGEYQAEGDESRQRADSLPCAHGDTSLVRLRRVWPRVYGVATASPSPC